MSYVFISVLKNQMKHYFHDGFVLSLLFLPHLVYLYSFFFFFFFFKSNLLQVRDAQGVPLVIAGWQRLVFGLSNLSEDHKAPKVRTGTFLSKQDTIGPTYFW